MFIVVNPLPAVIIHRDWGFDGGFGWWFHWQNDYQSNKRCMFVWNFSVTIPTGSTLGENISDSSAYYWVDLLVVTTIDRGRRVQTNISLVLAWRMDRGPMYHRLISRTPFFDFVEWPLHNYELEVWYSDRVDDYEFRDPSAKNCTINTFLLSSHRIQSPLGAETLSISFADSPSMLSRARDWEMGGWWYLEVTFIWISNGSFAA